MTTKEENPVYIKLEYDEALQAKRDLLSLQMNLLRILKIIRHYKTLRMEELRTKAKTYRKLKELALNVKKIKETLPKVKIHPIKKDYEENKLVRKIKETTNTGEDEMLESQLQEIQERLRAIGG